MKLARLIGIETIVLFSISLLLPLVWMPIFFWINSDIMINNSAFSLIWDWVQELLVYLFYWFSVSSLAVSLLCFSWKGFWIFSGVYLGSSIIRRFGILFSEWIILQDFEDSGLVKLLDASFYILLDLLLLGILLLVFYLFLMRKKSQTEREVLLPPQRRFKPTVLHWAILTVMLIRYVIQLFIRIRYDVMLGSPSSQAEMMEMICYYVADIALIAIGYFVVILLLQLFTKHKIKKSV